ncbi:MAG TPA: hypothetical protein P5511_10490, partial [Candidatus Goldiibacteriota bacterium]|nr:hypothetical protein [Candidatus Goldiibacteriota bacterium]
LVIFSMVGNGWAQFAARYTLDFQLFALILTVFLFKPMKGRLIEAAAAVLILLSVYVQFVGAWHFRPV